MPVKITPVNYVTSVNSESPNSGYNNAISYWVGRESNQVSNPDYWDMYIKPSSATFSGIPSNATITYARLIFVSATYFYTNSYKRIALSANNSDWSYSSITYNNRPSLGTTYFDGNLVENGENHLNINSWAQSALTNSTQLLRGFRLRAGTSCQNAIKVYTEEASYTNDGYKLPQLYIEYSIPLNTSPPSINVNPNSARSALTVSGGQVDSGTSSVTVHSSTDNVNFSLFGNASLYSSSWSIDDNIKASIPGTPNITLSTVSGDDIKVSWAAVSQPGVTKYYKAFKTLTNGTTTAFSNSVGNTLVPSTTKYTVERLIQGETVWSKLADVSIASTLEYIDTTLPLETSAQYRVYATNSQNSISGTSPKSIKVLPTAVPTFNTLEVINNSTFRLSGTGAVVSG